MDPAYTSQRCPRCGHTERANRRTRDHLNRVNKLGRLQPSS
ncbi:zinc ribbon domain-containing protein [Streptomyces sp. Inha503]